MMLLELKWVERMSLRLSLFNFPNLTSKNNINLNDYTICKKIKYIKADTWLHEESRLFTDSLRWKMSFFAR